MRSKIQQAKVSEDTVSNHKITSPDNEYQPEAQKLNSFYSDKVEQDAELEEEGRLDVGGWSNESLVRVQKKNDALKISAIIV